MCVSVVHMYVYHVCDWCSQRSEEGIRPSGTGVRNGCEAMLTTIVRLWFIACVCEPCACSTHDGQKRALDPLGLELQMGWKHPSVWC